MAQNAEYLGKWLVDIVPANDVHQRAPIRSHTSVGGFTWARIAFTALVGLMGGDRNPFGSDPKKATRWTKTAVSPASAFGLVLKLFGRCRALMSTSD